jgi:DNA-binding CsgD family transcriptional regulator
MHKRELLGRTAELRRLDRFLAAAGARRLLVNGPPGIGKSALVDAAVADAGRRGFQVLRAVANPAESYLPYATLQQLLQPTLGRLGQLPDPQRVAVEAAFGLAVADVPPEVLFIGLGTLRLIALAGDNPIAVLDDGHWMDGATRAVVEFVWRRLDREPIRMLIATRDEVTTSLIDPADVLTLHPLAEDDARALAQRAGDGMSGERLRRVLDLAAGNPLALQELPQALPADLTAMTGDDLPLVTRMERTFTDRLRLLNPTARDILLAVSLNESDLVTDALAAVTHLAGTPARLDAVGQAERAGLVTREAGRLRFLHPLVASALARAAGPARVERMHRALAATTNDAYAAVWHRAHATTGPDEEVAESLEAAADLAQSRGATRAARAAMMRAAALSADERNRARRLVEAAELAFELGEPQAVGRLMEEARTLGLDEPSAARLAFLEGRFDDGAANPALAVDRQLARAEVAIEFGGQELAAQLLVGASRACYTGAVDDLERSAAVLALTTRLRLAPDDANVLLVRANLSDSDRELLDRLAAAAAGDAKEPGGESLRALAALVAGDWPSSHLLAARASQGLRRQGRLGLLAQALTVRGLAGLFLGQWEDVAGVAEQAEELARETEQSQWEGCARTVRAGLAALQGRAAVAEGFAADAAEFAVLSGNVALEDVASLMRGLAMLGVEQHQAAYEILIARMDPRGRVHHPRQSMWGIDLLAEAAALAGLAGEARERLDRCLTPGGPIRAPAQIRTLALTRALLSSEEDAEEAYLAASAVAVGAPAWFRARLDLNYGMWLRRRRRGTEARDQLQPCVAVFDHLGAVAWAGRARRELAAIGRRTSGGSGTVLTAQELQIARLAAQGLTNREIGQRLHVSHRTVGSHLYKVFAKLDVSSRNQLHLALPKD